MIIIGIFLYIIFEGFLFMNMKLMNWIYKCIVNNNILYYVLYGNYVFIIFDL